VYNVNQEVKEVKQIKKKGRRAVD